MRNSSICFWSPQPASKSLFLTLMWLSSFKLEKQNITCKIQLIEITSNKKNWEKRECMCSVYNFDRLLYVCPYNVPPQLYLTWFSAKFIHSEIKTMLCLKIPFHTLRVHMFKSIYIEMAHWNIDSDDWTETRVWIKGSRSPKSFYFIHLASREQGGSPHRGVCALQHFGIFSKFQCSLES